MHLTISSLNVYVSMLPERTGETMRRTLRESPYTSPANDPSLYGTTAKVNFLISRGLLVITYIHPIYKSHRVTLAEPELRILFHL